MSKSIKEVMSRSEYAKKARKGTDMGKKNVPGKSGFAAVAGKAAKEYGSKEAGDRVAGAIANKMRKAGKL